MSDSDSTSFPDSQADARLDEQLARAEEMLEDQHFDKAADHLRKVIIEFPDSPLPHHALSVVYLERLRRDYEHVEVWEDLTDDEADFEVAVAEAEAAIQTDENFVPARNNLGTLFALRGWWKDAIRQWEISLTVRPDQSQIREELTRARKQIGEE